MNTGKSWRQSLRESLDRAFSLDERKDLAFDLGLNHEQLGLDVSSRELIYKCEREKRLHELLELCAKKRPNENWPEIIPIDMGGEVVPAKYEPGAFDWQFLVGQIEKDICSPVISNSLIEPVLFPNQNMIHAWAEHIHYPLKDAENLPRVAQFAKVIYGHEYVAKDNYLNFIKRCLLDEINTLDRYSKTAKNSYSEREFAKLNMGDLIRKLITLRTGTNASSLVEAMAQLPLSVFITTSFHTVLEEALRFQGKTPITDFYRWSDQLVASYGDNARLSGNHIPSEKEPLVYHLLGLDNEPSSLVLTEDDYFDFFERASQDVQRADGLPVPVRNTFTKDTLILLGYDIQNWPFRVVFRGPIKSLFRKGSRHLSYAIQLIPSPEHGITDTEAFQQYIQGFFREYQFSLYWGEAEDFVNELFAKREG